MLVGEDQDLWLFMRLGPGRCWDLVFKDGCPSAGCQTTDCWKEQEIIGSVHRPTIPEEAAQHRYRLTLSTHAFDRLG